MFSEETFDAACEARGGTLAKIERYLVTQDGTFRDEFRLDATNEYEPLVVVLSDVTLYPAAAYRHADDVLFRNIETAANHHFPGQVDAIIYDPRQDENRTPNVDPRVTATNAGYEHVGGDGLTLYVPRRTFNLNTVVPAW